MLILVMGAFREVHIYICHEISKFRLRNKGTECEWEMGGSFPNAFPWEVWKSSFDNHASTSTMDSCKVLFQLWWFRFLGTLWFMSAIVFQYFDLETPEQDMI